REVRVDSEQRDVRADRRRDPPDADARRADDRSRDERRDRERDPAGGPAGGSGEPEPPDSDGERNLDALRHARYRAIVLSALATASTKLTTRGPHRDAIESSIRSIASCWTAATFPHHGLASPVAGAWPQQRVSASTIRSGFASRMYSPESCG